MDLFSKLEIYIDYNNSYSLRKSLTTLEKEFDMAEQGVNHNCVDQD